MLRVLALLAVIAASAPAAADPSVGVLVSGDDATHSTTVVRVEAWLGKHNFAIATKALDKDARITVANCLVIADLSCARGVIEKRAKADSLVAILAQASGPKTNRELQLSAYWIAKNHEVVSLQRMCNHCTSDVLKTTLDGLMVDLSHLVTAMTGKVKITSTPSGLLVTVDNEAAGVTPLDRDLPAGNHDIALTRGGKVVREQSVVVTAGETNAIELVAPPVVEPKPIVIVRKSRAVPITLLALGGAAIATGAVFYAFGGPSGNSLYYRDLRTPGYFIGGSGVALAAVGAYLLVRGGSTSTPIAGVTSGGAMVGWAGRF